MRAAERTPLVRFPPPSEFACWAPIAPLAPFVHCFWRARSRDDTALERVLPNGVVEIIWNVGGDPHLVIEGDARPRRFVRAWIAGLQRGHLTIAAEGASDLLGVRFRPGGLAPWLAAPLAELTDRVEELDATPLAWLASLRDRLGDARDDDARLDVVETTLLATARSLAHDRRVETAVARLEASRCTSSLGALARELGVTHKHLVTLFHRRVGTSPMKLARILRFHRVVTALAPRREVRWAEVAARFGFVDQAHLTRDFRELAGVSPRAFLGLRSEDGMHLRP